VVGRSQAEGVTLLIVGLGTAGRVGPSFHEGVIAQSCAMSEVAAETAAEQGIRATCPATPMLSDA
jgi:hypothetical protein